MLTMLQDEQKVMMSHQQIQPTTETELQLFRVLQRANLLQYYDIFISQGEHLGIRAKTSPDM